MNEKFKKVVVQTLQKDLNESDFNESGILKTYKLRLKYLIEKSYSLSVASISKNRL